LKEKKMNMEGIDAVEVIEENLDYSRVRSICRKIANLKEKLWCLTLRKCFLEDE
jgi:hypothetical protein